MNFIGVAALPLRPETGTWFRAVRPQFFPTALHASHTLGIFSRFSPGPRGNPPFQILYLAEDPLVALFEVQALFGSPLTAGGIVANPRGTWVTVNVQVQLAAVADLTLTSAQGTLATTAQELTGDWTGYQLRNATTSVWQPVGLAPTQELGEALQSDPRPIEGFRTLSARLPYYMNLIVFPQNMRKGSFVKFTYNGQEYEIRNETVRRE